MKGNAAVLSIQKLDQFNTIHRRMVYDEFLKGRTDGTVIATGVTINSYISAFICGIPYFSWDPTDDKTKAVRQIRRAEEEEDEDLGRDTSAASIAAWEFGTQIDLIRKLGLYEVRQ